MKYLRVTMPDNSKWDVPAEVIAKDRALYYASRAREEGVLSAALFKTDKALEHSDVYEEEFDVTMGDEYEISDWAANNMNWQDVKKHAKLAPKQSKTDYQEGWLNGEKEVVEY